MDRRERASDPTTVMLAVLDGWQSQLWTALPGMVVKYKPSADGHPQTVDVQPTVQARWQSPDGTWQWVTIPLLLDCPVHFPKGGGVTLTFPVREGDECLVVFSSRCIDSWWQQGGVQVQAELRMHDLSDGFAFVGFSSKPAVIPALSTTAAQLRTDDGKTYVEVDPHGPSITATTPGKVNVHAGSDLTGMVGGNASVTVKGNTVAEVDGTTTITSKGHAVWNVPAGLKIVGNVEVEGKVDATGEGTFNGGHTVSQHTHSQQPDAHGDTEMDTNKPQG